MTQISENMVGIVTTLDGAPLPEGQIAGRVTEGHSRFQNADAFLAAGDSRGLQPQVILAGSYFLNTITVRSKASARFGNMNNLVSQVLEPTIGNYFRNSAQDSDVISFLSTRKKRQASARGHINAVLDQYNVNGVDTLIGDIVPPESLLKTLTDRKLAEEQKVIYDTQRMAQETRQDLEKQTAIADIQKQLVQADQGVQGAERVADAAVKKAGGDAASVRLNASAEAERTKVLADAEARRIALTGNAEAEKILAIGKANAESYQLQVNAMGGDNFTRTKIAEIIGKDKVKVMPDILITGGDGGSNGALSGLLGMKLIEELGGKVNPPPVLPPVIPVVISKHGA